MPVMLTHNFIRFLLSLHEKFKTPDIQELGPQNGSQYHPFATKKRKRTKPHEVCESFHEPDCLLNYKALFPSFPDLHFKFNHYKTLGHSLSHLNFLSIYLRLGIEIILWMWHCLFNLFWCFTYWMYLNKNFSPGKKIPIVVI